MKQTKIQKIVKESKILNIHKSHYVLIPKTIIDATNLKPHERVQIVLNTHNGRLIIEPLEMIE